MHVGEIMKRDVTTASPEDTFVDAAKLLRERGISSIVVMDGKGISGIVTERDLVGLVAEGADPGAVTLGERMSRNLDTVEPTTDIADAAEHMARLKIRHLPVVERGSLVGIISIRDLIDWAVAELTAGHELPDMERSHTALAAAVEVNRSESGSTAQ